MNSFGSFLRKRRSFSFWDILSFIINFIITYSGIVISLYLAIIITFPEQQPITAFQWRAVFFGGLASVAVVYLREIYIFRKKDRTIKGTKVIYDCFGGAIEQLIEIKEDNKPAQNYVNELLKYIEKVVIILLKDNQVSHGEICANLMIRKKNPERLDLEFFGTFLSGRTKLTLPLENKDSLNPGAPEAFHLRKVTYIDNTMSEKYSRFFSESKPYRSIISIPVGINDASPFAVLNIDSDIPDQFVSVDFINKKIIPTVSPFISLIRLERDIIISGINTTSEKEEEEG